MTTHNTSNFVHELVTMAQAVEELPKLQAEIARLQALVATQEYELSARESHVELLRNSNEELSSKLRSAEVERDNAGFRELAATDALDVLKRVMQTTFHNLGETLKAAQPVVASDPTADTHSVTATANETVPPHGADSTDVAMPVPSSSSEGEIPTAPTTTEPWPPVQSGTADASGGASSGTAALPSEPWAGPYAGMVYYDLPRHISEADWLAGGGSYEAYHWRPHFGARPAA